jgi:hypothetical protein
MATIRRARHDRMVEILNEMPKHCSDSDYVLSTRVWKMLARKQHAMLARVCLANCKKASKNRTKRVFNADKNVDARLPTAQELRSECAYSRESQGIHLLQLFHFLRIR